jgi:hypothetical protein
MAGLYIRCLVHAIQGSEGVLFGIQATLVFKLFHVFIL